MITETVSGTMSGSPKATTGATTFTSAPNVDDEHEKKMEVAVESLVTLQDRPELFQSLDGKWRPLLLTVISRTTVSILSREFDSGAKLTEPLAFALSYPSS